MVSTSKLALVKYANALLLWNEAVQHYQSDTGKVKKTSVRHKLLRKAKITLDDLIMKEAGVKRYYSRGAD